MMTAMGQGMVLATKAWVIWLGGRVGVCLMLGMITACVAVAKFLPVILWSYEFGEWPTMVEWSVWSWPHPGGGCWVIQLGDFVDANPWNLVVAAGVVLAPVKVYVMWLARRGLMDLNERHDDGDPLLLVARVVHGNSYVDAEGVSMVLEAANVSGGGVAAARHSARTMWFLLVKYAFRWHVRRSKVWWFERRHINAAWGALLTGRWDKAEVRSQKALTFSAGDLVAETNLALALLMQGRREEAFEIYERNAGRVTEYGVAWETMCLRDLVAVHWMGFSHADMAAVAQRLLDEE